MTDAASLAAYLLDNYGTCKRGAGCGKDGCLRNGWIGHACENWQPLGATTYEELEAAMREERTAR